MYWSKISRLKIESAAQQAKAIVMQRPPRRPFAPPRSARHMHGPPCEPYPRRHQFPVPRRGPHGVSHKGNGFYECAAEKAHQAAALQKQWEEAMTRAEEEERMHRNWENEARRIKQEWEVVRQEADHAAAVAEKEERKHKEWEQAMAVATSEFEMRRQEAEQASCAAQEQEQAAREANAVWEHKQNAAKDAARILEEVRQCHGGHGSY